MIQFLSISSFYENTVCRTWMDLESVILSEVGQTNKLNIIGCHLFVESKKNKNKNKQTKNDANELTYKTEIESQT